MNETRRVGPRGSTKSDAGSALGAHRGHLCARKPRVDLSMEFLIGRSLSNIIMNLLFAPIVKRAAEQRNLDWLGLIEREPDAGLGNGGLGRLAACFLASMSTMQLPAMGYGPRHEYGIFKQSIRGGWVKDRNPRRRRRSPHDDGPNPE